MSTIKATEHRERPKKVGVRTGTALPNAVKRSAPLRLVIASGWSFPSIPLAIPLLLVVLIGCIVYLTTAPNRRNSDPQNSSFMQRLTPEGQLLLAKIIKSGNLPELQWTDFRNIQEQVRELYDSMPGGLIWTRASRPTPQAVALANVFKNADAEGLDPTDYDGHGLDQSIAALSQPGPHEESALVRFDLRMTVSAIRFVIDLGHGRANPNLFGMESAKSTVKLKPAELVRTQLANSPDIEGAIQGLEPPFPTYQRTRAALKKYRSLALQDDGARLPIPPSPVRPGDSYPALARLAKLLSLVGDLPEPEADVSQATYNGTLVNAVRHFQRRHGLEPNGLIDAATLFELNTPLTHRVIQLQLTLERLRWLPQTSPPMLVVNIPEFRLRAVDDQYRWTLFMKVVVGKAYRRQTPVFGAELQSIIFRPPWEVPLSIVRSEMLPHVKNDPSYFSKHSYQILTAAGAVVTDGPVNEETERMLYAGELRVRQPPGPQNALGLIKFDFPNVHDVYMHGTPATELFARSRRDFSHGCIRVEDPVALAAWLLRGNKEWNDERIRAAMFGEKTSRVVLQRSVPVLIVYGTAVVMEDGEVRFFRDIYEQDPALLKALANRHAHAKNN